ncbi:MAG TPA: hypothetical protein DDZ76_01000 [Xanthomonadales bacterium]|nr:hypothetical protein [Xanthomonadales bacterium]
MPFLRAILLVCLSSATIIGCSSTVKRDASSTAESAATHLDKPALVQLTLSAEGRKAAGKSLKFDADELKETIERALKNQNLLADPDATDAYRVDVEITSVRVRSNFSAVAFGFMAGSDRILGTVTARDSQGRLINRFNVNASYALGGLAGGMDQARTGWLYEKFAEETLIELTSTERKPEKVCKRTHLGVQCRTAKN